MRMIMMNRSKRKRRRREGGVDEGDDDSVRKDLDHLRFHTVLLQHLYTGDPIITTNVFGKRVQQLSTEQRISVMKQKAVSQPTFKHRRWMGSKKNIVSDGGIESISNIETKLPPLRGEGGSFASYVTELERVEGKLTTATTGSRSISGTREGPGMRSTDS
ncbi:hypothetical protein BC939DRAFT_34161 [Gamsiella multidivaricata]|uniref:uncharacterized protein n=1 Tax=Gamsiella multidivaricata TaxID=101098 RepID=UPI00221F1FD3|nr:uncharacterized protein BC939DRAFT_34161 [Gamsiella multidivaricata]KAI7816655.1 hypothetical protein BC939DRAFT_34161 [Gamsiella multidivaricata]